jgi:hypothetical protein
MSGIKIGRFSANIEVCQGGYSSIEYVEDENGDIVFYSDHAAALAEKDAEIERLKKVVELMAEAVRSHDPYCCVKSVHDDNFSCENQSVDDSWVCTKSENDQCWIDYFRKKAGE